MLGPSVSNPNPANPVTTPSNCFENYDKNPLESLVLAHNENIHSAVIAWLVRNLKPTAKAAFLKTLIGLEIDENDTVTAETEKCDIDILITVTREGKEMLYVIENKLKASVDIYENPRGNANNQLEKVEQDARKLAVSPGAELITPMILLSYFAELPPGTENWQIVSYETLKNALAACLDYDASPYLVDYHEVVSRLVSAKQEIVASEPTDVFEKKVTSPLSRYASRGRLKVLFQQIWLKELARRINFNRSKWTLTFDSTNGHGLMNIMQIADVGGVQVCWGVQLHQGRMKVFAQPNGYPKKATEKQHDAVQTMLEDHIAPYLGGRIADGQLKAPKNRGFRSYTVQPELKTFGNYAHWDSRLQNVLDALESVNPEPVNP